MSVTAKICGLSAPETLDAAIAGEIRAVDVIVVRNEGPRGGPGMREMLALTSLL